MGGSGLEVYVVVACASTHDDLELGGSVEDLLVDDVAADDDGVDISDGSQQLALGAVLLEEDDLEASLAEDGLDPCYGGGSKGLFGGNKDSRHSVDVMMMRVVWDRCRCRQPRLGAPRCGEELRA